jgi:hypothetical protein
MSVRAWAIVCCFITLNSFAQKINDARDVMKFTEGIFDITEVMFHDVVNPPAAARFYSYAVITAYDVVEQAGTDHQQDQFSLSTALKNFPDLKIKGDRNKVFLPFCATYAMLQTAKTLIPSGYSLQDKQDMLYKFYLKAGIKKQLLDSSVVYAINVSQMIVAYSKSDGYLNLSTLRRFQPQDTDSTWQPTPPEYMAAVEPHWSTIRTFFLDSSTQFKPHPPVSFSSASETPFRKLVDEVYFTGRNLSDDQKLVAQYWDCNPFANFYAGHVSVAIKKISPGGHWMNITAIACKKAKMPFEKAVQVHTLVAMGLHDGFISCWSAKYRSNRIRPKTVINRFLDEKWNPLLETPPFPEYTSGHSVISTVSAGILTYFLGDGFEFVDNTEVMFGFAPRRFNSFKDAANEAAISRLYGGIHFRDAIENGQKQGEEISNFIINKFLNTPTAAK